MTVESKTAAPCTFRVRFVESDMLVDERSIENAQLSKLKGTKRFRRVPPLVSDDANEPKILAHVYANASCAKIGNQEMNVREAINLRDWLNAVLP